MNNPISIKLKVLATGMEDKIQKKLNPATAQQNPTPRRAGIIKSMVEDGIEMRKVQSILYALADLHEKLTCPANISWIKNQADVKALLHGRYNDNEKFLKYLEVGIVTSGEFTAARQAILNLIDQNTIKAAQATQALREQMTQELELVGQVPGYFPTPAAVVDAMLDHVGVIPTVFDPSAGGGRILDRVKEIVPGTSTVGVEINQALAKIARIKGHQVFTGDIMQPAGTDYDPMTRQYDTILMNPPFENKQDEEMIEFVFNKFLVHGGTLVSVVAGMNPSGKSGRFQNLITDHGEWEELPEGSFKASKTGVHTFLVILNK